MQHSLVGLFQSAEVNSFASSARAMGALSEDQLHRIFEQQRKTAPCRGFHKPYFVGHTGKTTSASETNRREEHLAIAVWQAYRQTGFALPDGTRLFPVEYQLPLKSHRDEANAGLGKADLFCAQSEGEPWIVEMKVHPKCGGRIDTPLKALLEALAYCALLDADMSNLSRESTEKKNMLLHTVRPLRPNLLILAPSPYWDLCEREEERHCWREAIQALSERIEQTFKIKVRFVRMDNCQWMITECGVPNLIEHPVFNWAIPMPDYLNQLIARFWSYRDQHFPTRQDIFLNQRRQSGKPPVFRAEFADLNIVAPESSRTAVLGTLPVRKRQQWFSSMRSSQALTQSVFGTLKALDKLHLLTNVKADDGGFAFFTETPLASDCYLEHPCTSLGELTNRETKSDVFFDGKHKVSVECKLAEDAVGSCSQPTILPTAPNYDRDLCDGTYTRQRLRRERCSLTEKRILYWQRIPAILRWNADADRSPCPMRTPYQLVRNLLVAESGHAVLVYDSRNPQFQNGGDCTETFERVRNDLHDPMKLRRCSWQAICGVLSDDSDLHDFMADLKMKFGF